jgi:hypothetical protein
MLMLTQFRIRYPQGSLISELVQIDRGKYVVKALVQVEGVILATGLAAAETIEQAEDRARSRALAVLAFNSETTIHPESTPKEIPTAPTIASIEPEANESVASWIETDSPNISLSQKRDRQEEELTKNNLVFSDAMDSPSDLAIDTPLPEHKVTSESRGKKRGKNPPESLALISETPLERETQINSAQSELEFKNSLPESNSSLIQAPSNINMGDVPIELIDKSDLELKRLGWTKEQGRDFLVQTYGKRSRHLLTDLELQDFIEYLQSQPTPPNRN